eukprot:6506860-Alexandrium_andersonii.AAC.1
MAVTLLPSARGMRASLGTDRPQRGVSAGRCFMDRGSLRPEPRPVVSTLRWASKSPFALLQTVPHACRMLGRLLDG